jgi:hypothetical protein
MATRSRIAIERETGTVNSIYCHWDGYPSHNGKILTEHYTDRAKVYSLINLGDISSLAVNLEPGEGETHSFEKPVNGVTVAYHRDRGEEYTSPTVHLDRNAFMASDVEEFGYLFTKEGDWFVIDGNKNQRTFTPVETYL